MYNKDFDKIYPELKKAIIDWMFDNASAWQRLNACVDAFRAYIYDDRTGKYLIGGETVYKFIKTVDEII